MSIRRLKGSLHTVQPLYRHKGQPLLDEIAALRSWLRRRQPDGSDFLFLSQKGGRLHRSQFFRIFRGCASAAGLASMKCHPHVLKHSLASHLVARQCKSSFDRALPGTQGHIFDNEICWHFRLSVRPSRSGSVNEPFLTRNKTLLLLHFRRPLYSFHNNLRGQ